MNVKRGKRRLLTALITDLALAAIVAGLFLSLEFLGSGRAAKLIPASAPACAVYKGRKGCVAIVCTAGWNAASITDMLDCLDENGVKITFALSLSAMREDPELAARIHEKGHELAVLAENASDPRRVKAGAQRTAELMEERLGVRPKLIVIAGDNAAAERAAAQLRMTAVAGTLDLVCVRGSADEIARRARGNTNGGDIVFCAPTAAFAEALPRILEYYSSMGLTCSTVSGTIYD